MMFVIEAKRAITPITRIRKILLTMMTTTVRDGVRDDIRGV